MLIIHLLQMKTITMGRLVDALRDEIVNLLVYCHALLQLRIYAIMVRHTLYGRANEKPHRTNANSKANPYLYNLKSFFSSYKDITK